MEYDADFDVSFREILVLALSKKPAICARCGRAMPAHLIAAWLDELDDHNFEKQCVN